MASREEIELDFKRAMWQADRVDEIAGSLSDISNGQYEETLQNLSVGWKGENANQYLKLGNALQNKMNSSVENLHGVARDIRVTARKIYQAEMAALEIAKRREY